MYTVLACCNAAGEFLPPHVIYKSKHLYRDWCIGGPKDTSYNSTKSGWMESKEFATWFEKKFIPQKARTKKFYLLMALIRIFQ